MAMAMDNKPVEMECTWLQELIEFRKLKRYFIRSCHHSANSCCQSANNNTKQFKEKYITKQQQKLRKNTQKLKEKKNFK